MAEKLVLLTPELILFAGVVVVTILGLSPRPGLRRALPAITAAFLLVAMLVIPVLYTDARLAESGAMYPGLAKYVKVVVCLVGIVLTMVGVGQIDRHLEGDLEAGRIAFDPIRASQGEYYGFFLLSLIGLMLCTMAGDLIWLFLALELTSLPTYIMIAMSRSSRRAQEASMKYFFLGAMAAAIFLYGFALLYGSTGSIVLAEMQSAFLAQERADGAVNLLGIVGLTLAILGLSYKIAAAPMHFYAADVYEGAASPVTAFLGFVPKAAGMVALILLLATLPPGDLPTPILTTLWMVAVLTMTLGNIAALLQSSVKRMLAYSSIAHSGYMIIGVIAGAGLGINAVLFYLLVYGLMNTGAFAVLAGLERQGQEIESIDDLAGLRHRHPAMAWAMALCAGSLLGFPPLLGFIGKIYLFIAGIQAGQLALVVIAAVNSAISAWYYLRLVGLPILSRPNARSETIERTPTVWPRVAAIAVAVAVVVLPIFAGRLIAASEASTTAATPAASPSLATDR